MKKKLTILLALVLLIAFSTSAMAASGGNDKSNAVWSRFEVTFTGDDGSGIAIVDALNDVFTYEVVANENLSNGDKVVIKAINKGGKVVKEIEVVLIPPTIEKYGIVKSSALNYSQTGMAGWSVSEGKVVLCGGFSNPGPVMASMPGLPDTEYSHYTYGDNEYGWVVQNGGVAGQGDVYAIEANKPAGYQVITKKITGFNSTGWAGWSAPKNKVVLGGGFEANGPVSTSAPAGPNTVWSHYTYGPNEYGWVVQSAGATEITIYVVVADEPKGYEIVKSAELQFSSTGWAGWSVTNDKVVLGGGFSNTSPVRASYPAGPGTQTPSGYTYGANEYGWLVQSHEPGGPGYIYVIYADAE